MREALQRSMGMVPQAPAPPKPAPPPVPPSEHETAQTEKLRAETEAIRNPPPKEAKRVPWAPASKEEAREEKMFDARLRAKRAEAPASIQAKLKIAEAAIGAAITTKARAAAEQRANEALAELEAWEAGQSAESGEEPTVPEEQGAAPGSITPEQAIEELKRRGKWPPR